jgi:hypothetical protein
MEPMWLLMVARLSRMSRMSSWLVKQFGRDDFERGDYKVPAEDAKIIMPRHGVYRPR